MPIEEFVSRLVTLINVSGWQSFFPARNRPKAWTFQDYEKEHNTRQFEGWKHGIVVKVGNSEFEFQIIRSK